MQNRLKIYRVVLGCIILLFLYVLLIKIIPEYIGFWGLISEYQDAGEQFNEDSKWKERSIALKLDINKIKKKITEINLDIPSEYELYKPLNLLDSLCQQNNIVFDKMQYISVDTVKQYQFVLINITLKSRFNFLKKLIEQIENSSLIVMVEGIQFQLPTLYTRDLKAVLSLKILLRRRR
jgi:hypothetical protein